MKRVGKLKLSHHGAVNAPPTTEYCLTKFVPRLPAVSEVQFNLSDQTPSTISSTSRTEWICRDENRSIFGDQIPWRYKEGQFSWAHLMCCSGCCCCWTQTQTATLPPFYRFIWSKPVGIIYFYKLISLEVFSKCSRIVVTHSRAAMQMLVSNACMINRSHAFNLNLGFLKLSLKSENRKKWSHSGWPRAPSAPLCPPNQRSPVMNFG